MSVTMAPNSSTLCGPYPGLSGRGLSGFSSLARQTSIYSLTLDEFQNSIPEVKDFGSMNMDEFLKNIWTAEEQQAMQAALMTSTTTEAALPASGEGGLARQSSLQRQGSLNLPRTLSRKTVDEVWRDIHATNDGVNAGGTSQQQRSSTLGEMTLEDFLVRAGVVRDDLETVGTSFVPVSAGFPAGSNGTENGGDRQEFKDRDAGVTGGDVGGVHSGLTLSPANAQAAMDAIQLDAYKQQQWLTDQYRNAQQQQAVQMIAAAQQQQAEAAAYVSAAKRMGNGAPMAGLGQLTDGLGNGLAGGLGIGLGAGALALAPTSPTSPVSDGMGNGPGNGLSLSPAGAGFGFDGLRGRKRGPDGPVERVVERRQRRMIKNRESAARSRARKQAYTVELEAEVTQLKEENMRLRKMQQEEEMKKKQLIEAMVTRPQQSGVQQSRIVNLRRTRSGPW
eukprot:TRINITY_DN895_c0_g1_i2.p1 TRINITY_DN895_c0_g1~~TRINITY_DN895_c0_g1_i2.p1  ORF type:complete len:479 (-),score=97.09 TRINITY_DN895_c0_g1_i2:919-2262(-)